MLKNMTFISNTSTITPPTTGPKALPTVEDAFTIPWYAPIRPLGASLFAIAGTAGQTIYDVRCRYGYFNFRWNVCLASSSGNCE